MIFAKLDVDFYDHPRFIAAGLTGAGLWAFALAYVRKHAYDRARPGCFSKEADFLRRPGAAVAAKRLVEVGLWIDRDDVYEIHNYAAKNEGADDIEARRAADRDRQARARAAKGMASGFATGDPGARSRDASRDTHPTPSRDASGAVPGSGSGSGSGSDLPGEREREPPNGNGFAFGGMTSPPDDVPITDAIRGACVMAGAPEPTREHVVAMLANAREKGKFSRDWSETLVAWMVREKQYAARVGGRGRRAAKPVQSRAEPGPSLGPVGDGPMVEDEISRVEKSLAQRGAGR